jgi:uncharacterized protein YgbK (DUF1537 family)
MPLTPIAIIADDLTGAADTAAVFVERGRPVPVSLTAEPFVYRGRVAFAATTESRGCSPATAADKIAAAVRALEDTDYRLIYKKVDSNLRGNVGAELGAVRDVLGQAILVCPAFPIRGRTVINGQALIHSVPVAQTEMARDQQAPVQHSDIADTIREQRPDLSAGLLTLEEVRRGAPQLSALSREHGVVIADAETDADLVMLAQVGLGMARPPIFCGSAGLAAALARLVLTDGPETEARGPTDDSAGDPVRADLVPILAVLASSSDALARQVRVAEEQLRVAPIRVDCERLSWDEEQIPELAQAIEQAAARLLAGGPALVQAVGCLPSVPRPVDLVVEHLAHLAFVAVKQGSPVALLLGGGATAHAVLSALGTAAIEVDDSPLPGLAAGITVGGHFANEPIALKPGAAGEDDALTHLIRYLATRHRAENSLQEHTK